MSSFWPLIFTVHCCFSPDWSGYGLKCSQNHQLWLHWSLHCFSALSHRFPSLCFLISAWLQLNSLLFVCLFEGDAEGPNLTPSFWPRSFSLSSSTLHLAAPYTSAVLAFSPILHSTPWNFSAFLPWCVSHLPICPLYLKHLGPFWGSYCYGFLI